MSEREIELIFRSERLFGRGRKEASAYIAMGTVCEDEQKRPMITNVELSYDALKGQVDYIKALLDARLAEAKARFAVTL
jgi:hypothetical protein